jgi:hypothetical protein
VWAGSSSPGQDISEDTSSKSISIDASKIVTDKGVGWAVLGAPAVLSENWGRAYTPAPPKRRPQKYYYLNLLNFIKLA